jgi:nucleotide-binding universal stress UspA family protein
MELSDIRARLASVVTMEGELMNEVSSRPVIVVGCDGSEGSAAAVRFGATEAQLRGGVLRIVVAYDPTLIVYGYGYVGNDMADQYMKDARSAAEDVRDKVMAELNDPVDVEMVVERGRPAQVLIDHSSDAHMLVVGARGLGTWGRLLMGSVSTEVVHHADVPVVVIPGGRKASSGSGGH